MRKPCFLGVFLLLASCIKDRNFDEPERSCTTNLSANVTFSEVKAQYQGELLQIQEDWILEGHVISSDRAGNFFNVLYFQDKASNPSEGFQIEIDLRDSHLLFPVGSKIFIKLKGLYLGKSRDVFKLGGTFAAFGTTSVGCLPALKIPEHIFISCDVEDNLSPTLAAISDLDSTFTNTLVRFENLEIIEQEVDSTFALEFEETERKMIDCQDNELILVNSGFADFHNEPLPQGSGVVTGVLLRENNDFLLAIRDLEDMEFVNERCQDLITEFTSEHLFFSELADPDNNSGARFVELYNAVTAPLDLNGWSINRYTNGNTAVSSTIDLSGYVIDGKSTLVISPDVQEFELVYGFSPDIWVGTNSPADSNGDDNLELVDPFGKRIDVFGIIGEDGSGTNHEFEDGRALRNPGIFKGNPNYIFSEWTLFNDTGASGTTNHPQSAPEDFGPGSRD